VRSRPGAVKPFSEHWKFKKEQETGGDKTYFAAPPRLFILRTQSFLLNYL
jgi:hypothetical protein